MHTYYWFDTSIKNLLFQGYNITTVPGLVATCFALAALAILLEAMRVFHALLKVDSDRNREEEETTRRWCLPSAKLKQLSIETACYIFEGVIGYLVMLSVMTYNGYFTIAVSCGAAFGYLLFGPQLLELRLNARNVYWKRNTSIVGEGELAGPLEAGPSAPLTPSSNHSRESLSEVAEGLVAAIHHAQETDVPVEVHRTEDQGVAQQPPSITITGPQNYSD